ncbi:MAG: hypothetical protein IJY20_05885 [Clostridia bacterium]|nr:hypothetical protein [Clostridia bacterium]
MSTIRFATFNIGDFTGLGFAPGSQEGKATIRATMASAGVRLWGLQEDVAYYNKETKESPYQALYDGYRHYERRGHTEYNYKAFLSDYEIRDVEQIFYTGDMKFRHPWFLRGTVEIEGKEICLISLHFDWSDKVVRGEQIRQVIAYADQHEYCIILGDFNPNDYINDGVKNSSRYLHEEEWPIFEAAGYSLANGGGFGYFDTILDNPHSPCPCDNIIVSNNIKIEQVGRVADEWMHDHAILFADISL